MPKLYGAGGSRWVKPYWTLKELGVAFEEVHTSIMKGDTRKPEYLAINPYGKIPTYVDESVTLTESAAICIYLADKYPDRDLIPKVGTIARAKFNQWVSVIISELEQPLWTMTRYTFLYSDAPHREGAIATAKKEFHRTASVIEKQISEFLVDGKFTVADIMMAYTLNWATMKPVTGEDLIAQYPKLSAYTSRMMARPAFPRHLHQ